MALRMLSLLWLKYQFQQLPRGKADPAVTLGNIDSCRRQDKRNIAIGKSIYVLSLGVESAACPEYIRT
jgi:hypothetical protein